MKRRGVMSGRYVIVVSMLKRIALVGAESTGTTTLARALAEHYGAPCVPEYGREYASRRIGAGAQGNWRTPEDFQVIAARQAELEDELAEQATDLLICDTEIEMVCVYEEGYTRATSEVNERLAAARSYALYVLTRDDIPFQADAIRDSGRRAWMTERLRERLAARPEPVVEVGGPHERRLAAAIAAIDGL